MYIMSKKNCSDIDAQAINEYKIPSIILMENAAEQIFNNIKNLANKYIIFCGNGNNGADGLAIGRKLLMNKKEVLFILINPKEKPTEEYLTNLEILRKLDAKFKVLNDIEALNNISQLIEGFDIVVDSIFGIGLHRELNDLYKGLLGIINTSNKKIISVDVPSGLDADSGKPLGAAIKAQITYTVETIKKGFIEYEALEYLGDLNVVFIGIPEKIKAEKDEHLYLLNKYDYSNRLIKRNKYGHKGNYGRSVIFAGSLGYFGAARLCTEACIRSGAGLTTLITSKEGQQLLSGSIVEGMISNFSEKEKVKSLLSQADSVAFGPGIEENDESMKLLHEIIINSPSNLVIDAGGINLLSKNKEVLLKVKDKIILTPHPGEMARLIGKDVAYINENRIKCAKEFAEKYKCIVVLKGYRTVITDGYNTYINSTGDSRMASGGMGDALTGLIAALIAQGYSNINAALLGAYIHGLAAEKAAENKYSIIASDLIEHIPNVMSTI